MTFDPGTAANVLHGILDALGGAPNSTGQIDTTSKTPAPTTTSSGGGEGYVSATGSGNNYQGTQQQDSFYQALLAKLGLPVTDQNLTLMRAWNQAEGSDAGNYNPFNTTQGAPGARDVNSVGVKAYSDFQSGVDATAQTLQNGNYAGILAGLASSDPRATSEAIANSPWGTGSLVMKILGYA